MKSVMVSLGKRIRKAREAAGVTQEELAERIGVSRSAVARWELGEIEPKLRNLIALAVELNVSTDELLGIPERVIKDKANLNSLGLSQAAMTALERLISEVRDSR